MTTARKKTSPLEDLVAKAIIAGLATKENAAEALVELKAAKLSHELTPEFRRKVVKETKDEIADIVRETPTDEQELLEWMANATAQALWVTEAKSLPVGPYAAFQALVRVKTQEGYTIRLGVTYCQDEELEEDFDDNFTLAEQDQN